MAQVCLTLGVAMMGMSKMETLAIGPNMNNIAMNKPLQSVDDGVGIGETLATGLAKGTDNDKKKGGV